MKKSLAASLGLATALMLSACGGKTSTETTNDTTLVNFDTPPDENVLLENDFGAVDGNVAAGTNSLDNAATSDGNTL